MQNVVLTVHLILALLLIGVVLLQRNEGGSLLSGGGAMTARGAANALTKLTWIFAAAFIATSITLTVLAAQQGKGGSVIEGSAPVAPSSGSQLPAPTGNLLPTLPSDAPATPPAADAPAAPPTPLAPAPSAAAPSAAAPAAPEAAPAAPGTAAPVAPADKPTNP